MMAPTILQIGAYAAGLAVAAPGVWLLIYRPEPSEEPSPPEVRGSGFVERLTQARSRMSAATRTVVGLCFVLLGYHLAAWAGPEVVFQLRIPPERWWLLACGIVLAVLGSMGADRLEHR